MPALGLTMTAMGAITAWGYQLAYTLFQVPSGMLGERLGARTVLLLTLLGCSVASFTAGLMPEAPAAAIGTLWITRVLLGVSQAAVFPVAALAVMIYVPVNQRVRATSCYMAAAALGAAMAPLLMAPVMERFGWRAVFLVSGAVAPPRRWCGTRACRRPCPRRRCRHRPRRRGGASAGCCVIPSSRGCRWPTCSLGGVVRVRLLVLQLPHRGPRLHRAGQRCLGQPAEHRRLRVLAARRRGDRCARPAGGPGAGEAADCDGVPAGRGRLRGRGRGAAGGGAGDYRAQPVVGVHQRRGGAVLHGRDGDWGPHPARRAAFST